MAKRIDIHISKDILTWAIQRADKDIDEFFIKNSDLEHLYTHTRKPTVLQLEKFAKKTYIPFGYLFLDTPPKERDPIPFFRSENNEDQLNIHVRDIIIELQNRQDWLSTFLKNSGAQRLPFVGKFSLESHIDDIIDDMYSVLNLCPGWMLNFSNQRETLKFITERTEEAGIIVSYNGVVGNNNRRQIPVKECRGFVLSNKWAPFIFINNADAQTAQLFTLIHELVHIWINKTAGFDYRYLQPAKDPIEKFCDKVAAEFLISKTEIRSNWDGQKNAIDNIKIISKKYKVSRIVIARRALDNNLIDKNTFIELYLSFLNTSKNKKSSTGGDFYKTAAKRVSRTFASYIKYAVDTNKLLYRDAYKLTNLYGKTFDRFYEKVNF